MDRTNTIYAVIDFETFSEIELVMGAGKKGVGAYEYSLHPSTEILCLAWRVGTAAGLAKSTKADTRIWASRLEYGEPARQEFIDILLNPKIILVAHNAFFEECITRNLFARKYVSPKMGARIEAAVADFGRWYCTMAQAQALALPASLGEIGKALDLEIKKDAEGARILQKWCKPRTPTDKNPKTRHDDPAEFEKLLDYCRTDIGSEVELFLNTPWLTPEEWKVWQLDQKINWRGFSVDRRLIESAMSIVRNEQATVASRAYKLSGGAVDSIKSPKQLKPWLEAQGCFLPNVKKETIEAAIDNGLAEGPALEMLELRQTGGGSSTAKFAVFERTTRSDGRCRGSIKYHGAGRTGRFAGAGVQPQNMPRPPRWFRSEMMDTACEVVGDGDTNMIRLLYGEPMQLLPALARGVIVASPRKVLHVADWNAIEARVLFWITGDTEGIKAFKEGRKIYEEQAAIIFGTTLENILAKGKESFERFVGKESILGCGYQMGPPRFKAECARKNIPITDEVADRAVKSFRLRHEAVTDHWYDIEKTAIDAVRSGRRQTLGMVSYEVEGDFLFCYLPSGRRTAYYKPEVVYEMNKWGKKQPKLYFWGLVGMPGKQRKWKRQSTYGGKLTENITQATARDIMVSAMQRVEAEGWEIVLSVHDELLSEIDTELAKRTHTIHRYDALLAEAPPWAEGCPLAVEGFETLRYRK